MAKQIWKPGNMLYPLPAVMVSTAYLPFEKLKTTVWQTNSPRQKISCRKRDRR